MSRTFEAHTPLEALVVEQALLLARQLQQAADSAPDGQVLAHVEALAVPAARELGYVLITASGRALLSLRRLHSYWRRYGTARPRHDISPVASRWS